MFLKQLIVCVGAVLIAANYVRADLDNLIKELEEQIRKVNEETEGVLTENEAVENRINSLTEQYMQKMEGFKMEHRNITQEIKKYMEEMRNLQIELSTLYNRENILKFELAKLLKEQEKLELAIKWLSEDVGVYKGRESTMDDEKCYDVENVTISQIVYKQMFSDNRSDEDMIVYLTNLLAQSRTDLQEAQQRNSELKTSLNNSINFWTLELSNLEVVVKQSLTNWAKAKTNLSNMTAKKEGVERSIAELEDNIARAKTAIAQHKVTLKELKQALAAYEKATSCYTIVTKDAIKHAE